MASLASLVKSFNLKAIDIKYHPEFTGVATYGLNIGNLVIFASIIKSADFGLMDSKHYLGCQ